MIHRRVASVAVMISLRFAPLSTVRGAPSPHAHALAVVSRQLHAHLLSGFNYNRGRLSYNNRPILYTRLASSDLELLTMDKIYSSWTIEDDRLLYDNRHLSTVRLASLLGRGMHGVEARLKKLSDVDSTAYARLFAGGTNAMHNEKDLIDQSNKGLTPVKEVLRRIQWDPTLPASSFTILHYDRVEDNLCETPFDAPNNSISGKETQFVFALPEHRIEGVKYLDRIVWDKEMRLDCVFGSMNGNGETIDKVIETYDVWKREKEEREERNKLWQIEILKELDVILAESRLVVLKDLSSQLMHDDKWDTEGVRNYVKRVVSLYHDAKREKIESLAENEEDEEFTEIVDYLCLFSDLVALLPDALLREEILKEVELVIIRSLGESTASSTDSKPPSQPVTLPELNEDDLDEKFVKGQGKGVSRELSLLLLVHLNDINFTHRFPYRGRRLIKRPTE